MKEIDRKYGLGGRGARRWIGGEGTRGGGLAERERDGGAYLYDTDTPGRANSKKRRSL